MAITYLSGNRIQGLLGSVTPAILAETGWTLFNSDHIITGSDGIRLQSGSDGYSYYDFGASDGINTNDEWVCDFDILRAASNDHYDHPMISLRSVHGVHGNPANNGDCKILLMYWANGDTGNSSGTTITNAYHKTSGSVTGVATEVNYCHQTGATLYYRIYMSKSGDDTGKLRQSAWTSDAYRTAEGATGRVIDNLSAATMAENGDWEAADDMRYLIVENSNGNEAWYTLKSFKFWNVASTGVADNMLSHTPTKLLTFNDVAAIPAPDEKATITNVPVGTRFEETDTRQIFRRVEGLTNKAGIKAYYNFEEDTDETLVNHAVGSDYPDGTGTTNNSTSTGSGVTRVTGKVGTYAYALDGTSDGIIAVGTDIITGTGAYTMAAWLWKNADASETVLYVGTTQEMMNYHATHNKFYGHNTQTAIATTDMGLGAWHHCAITRGEGGATVAKLYFDGVLEATETNNINLSSVAHNVTIGGYLSGEEWAGKIDELVIADRAFTGDEISTLYSVGVNDKWVGKGTA